MVKLCILLLLPIFLWGVNIRFTNLKEEIIPVQSSFIKKQYFKLFARYYVQKLSKKDSKLIFFNRKSFMLRNNYYADGSFETESSNFLYKKAYRFSNKLYFFNVKGIINHQKIKAKEIIYDGYKSYILKHCEVKKRFKILRRKQYIMEED